MTAKRFDFPKNIIILLLKNEEGNYWELKDTENVKVWNQFEQGAIFKKGRKIE